MRLNTSRRSTSRPTPPTADQIKTFIEALPSGRRNALNARALAPLVGITSLGADRKLRSLAQHATDEGFLVCTSNAGYYRPLSMDEAKESIQRIASQGVLMSQRARRMQHLADVQFAFQEKLL